MKKIKNEKTKDIDEIILYDINKDLCKAWEKYFKNISNVKIINCSFEELKSEYVVTAGNSYGWMTGGIDLVVRNYYKQEIQDIIQQEILKSPGRYLPVGYNVVINTGDDLKPNLIYAPTMDVPKQIDALDVFYIFSRLLVEFKSFACCGLGTGMGKVSVDDCASAMYNAYCYIRGDKNASKKN